MKRILLSIVTVATITTSSHALFGVGDVVFDPTAVAKAVTQIKKMKEQIKIGKKAVLAASGVKDAVKMYNDIKHLTQTMEDFKVTFEDLDIENPKSKIGVMAKKIFEENQVFDNCDVSYNSDLQKEICKDNQIRNVSEVATSIIYSKDLGKAAKRLQKLSKKLASSKDIKTSQDLGNAISLELAQIEISKSRVAMMEKSNDARRKADQDRLNQEADEKRGVPLDW